MPAVSTIIAGAGVAVSAASAIGGAVARGDAANAQGKQAQAQEDYARAQQAKAEQAAEPSAMELVQLQKQIDVTDRTVARQEELLKAVDPALIEASQQALKLLKGEASAATQPLERARQRQRQQLENRLREQLGPGFETSSAGIEALGRFDTETADAVQGAQQTALGGITNFLASSSKFRPDAGQLVGLTSVPMSSLQNIATRKTNAAIGGLGLTQFQGAEFGAQAAQAAGAADTWGGIGQLGGAVTGAALPGAIKSLEARFGGAPETPAAGLSGSSGGPSLGVNTTLPKPKIP